jgi:hypothetical protein
MDTLQKRFLLFLVGCMGTRFLFVWIAKSVDREVLPYLGYAAILPAVGFIYIWFTNARPIGAEVFGEKIWWNDLRPLHAILYGLFAVLAIQRYSCAWMVLLADALVGLTSFLVHHYRAGNLKRIIDLH